MKIVSRFSLRLAIVLGAAPAVAGSANAQEVVQPLPGTTDADRLADQIRTLAASPNDVGTLTTAGELSLRLDDLSGAASLFARADKVDPRNGRVKAGMASILVRSERPGEALRYFALAQSYGIEPRRFAADRGLAYDLIGEQERAQRDYRLALKDGSDGETIRRYALSLGIAGERDAALEQLDPLLRKNDRGAWRARAFVMAMTGDQAGAERIATTMMPPGLAEGLLPFFGRLPQLGAIDRAFAVHFGEVHASAERLADARLVPVLAPLSPEPSAQVVLAAVAPQPSSRNRRERHRDRRKGKPVEMAGLAPAVVPVRAELPAPPTYRVDTPPATPAGAQPGSQPVRVPVYRAEDRPLTPAEAASLAAATSRSRRGGRRDADVALAPAVTPARVEAASPARAAPTVALTGRPAIPAVATAQIAPVQVAAALPNVAAPVIAGPPSPTAASSPSPSTSAVLASTATPVPVQSVIPGSTETPPVTVAPSDVSPSTTAPAVALVRVPPAPVAPTARNEDTILARIIAGLSIPASELDVAAPATTPRAVRVPPPVSAAHVVAEAKAKEARDADAEKVLAAKAAADRRAAARQETALKRALTVTKEGVAKKLADAQTAADEKKASRASPARVWVQVAGGANEDDLPKAWAAVKARAPAVFGARQGWSTPLRATNRVLTGPFKSDAEARAFVNQLGKAGVSAFSFTSDAGQPVTRLPTR